MSLLLDALKEAEKSRKGLESTAEPASPAENPDVCLDLDLDQLEPEKVDSDKKGSETIELKTIAPETKEQEPEEPIKPISKEDPEQKEQPNKPSKNEPTLAKPSISAAPITVSTTAEAKTTDSVSEPAQIEKTTPIPATRPKVENSPRIAANVFQNQATVSSESETKDKKKTRVLLLLLLLLLIITGLVILYVILSKEPESVFPRPGYNIENTKTDQAAETSLLSIEIPTSSKNSASSIENTNVTLSKQSDQAAQNKMAPISSSQEVDRGRQTQINQPSGSATSTTKSLVADKNLEATKNLKATMNQEPTYSSTRTHTPKPASTVKPGIQISKRKLSSRSQSSLTAAQEALKIGDSNSAEQAYRQAIKESPENINATSALATLLAQQGRNQEAHTLFLKTLEKDPENLIAKTGLINIQATDPTNLSAGSELKQLLTAHPKQAHLHASLGNFHARRNEWPAAQAAYFEAFSLDPESADYAFNLAISLDQMGKPDIAANYYEKAIQLFGKRPSQLRKTDAERRLAELKGLNKTEILNQSEQQNLQEGITP